MIPLEDRAWQQMLSLMGTGFCYFLVLVRRAGKILGHRLDAYVEAWMEVDAGRVLVAPAAQVGYMQAPDVTFSRLTGAEWAVRKEGPLYALRPGEWAAARWEWQEPTTQGTILHSHFTDALDGWDPWGESLTRKNGAVQSLRVFTRKAVAV